MGRLFELTVSDEKIVRVNYEQHGSKAPAPEYANLTLIKPAMASLLGKQFKLPINCLRLRTLLFSLVTKSEAATKGLTLPSHCDSFIPSTSHQLTPDAIRVVSPASWPANTGNRT